MARAVPPVVCVHMFAALAALVIGTVQLARVGTMRGLYMRGLIIAGAFTLLPGRRLGNLVWKGCWAC